MEIILTLLIFSISYVIVYFVGRFVLYSKDGEERFDDKVSNENAARLKMLGTADRYRYESVLIINRYFDIVEIIGSMSSEVVEEFKSLYIEGVGTTMYVVEEIFKEINVDNGVEELKKFPEIMFLGSKRWHVHSYFDNTMKLLFIYFVDENVSKTMYGGYAFKPYEEDKSFILNNVENYIRQMLGNVDRESSFDDCKNDILQKLRLLCSRITGMNVEETIASLCALMEEIEMFHGECEDFLSVFTEERFLSVTSFDRRMQRQRDFNISVNDMFFSKELIFDVMEERLTQFVDKERAPVEVLGVKIDYLKKIIANYSEKLISNSRSYNKKILPLAVDIDLLDDGVLQALDVYSSFFYLVEGIVMSDENLPERRFLKNKRDFMEITFSMHQEDGNLVTVISNDAALLTKTELIEMTNGRYSTNNNAIQGFIVQDKDDVISNMNVVLDDLDKRGGRLHIMLEGEERTTFTCTIPIR